MRVGCYVRVSTQEQAKEGYSIPAQTERLKSYCAARDWTVCEVYSDPGYSGAKMERPALQKLIFDVKKGRLDLVLVYKLDRLSRSQKDTLYLIEDVFLKSGVAFVSLNENFDTSTAFGRAMIGVLSVFAQLEREQIKERTQMGRTERAKTGLWHGGGAPPIGYDYDVIKGQLIINEYEAMQVREAFDLYVNHHYSFTRILKTFREKGFRHKSGAWSSGKNLRYLLSNRVYLGQVTWEGQTYPGQHPSLIDAPTFAEAQRRLAERTWRNGGEGYTPFNATQLLTGVLFCGQCGARYFGAGAYRGSKKLPYSQRRYIHLYTCYSRAKTKADMIRDPSCKNKNWPTETLDGIVVEHIRRLELEQGYFDSVVEENRKKDDAEPARGILAHKIAALDSQISKLLDLYQFQELPAEQVASRLTNLTKEKETLARSLETMSSKESPLSAEQARKLLQGATELLQNAPIELRRDLIQSLIRRIDLTGDSVSITWSFL